MFAERCLNGRQEAGSSVMRVAQVKLEYSLAWPVRVCLGIALSYGMFVVCCALMRTEGTFPLTQHWNVQ